MKRLLLMLLPLLSLAGCCPGTCESQLAVELPEGLTEFTLVVATPSTTFTVTCPMEVDDVNENATCDEDVALFSAWGVEWYGPLEYELDGSSVQPLSTESSTTSVCGVNCRFVTVQL